jgi:F0F1-type ATP synthase assembly protein I
MDSFEKIGYICLGLVAVCYLVAMLAGMVATFPFGLIGLVAIVGVGALLIKVIKERRSNAEDDHYSKTVDK